MTGGNDNRRKTVSEKHKVAAQEEKKKENSRTVGQRTWNSGCVQQRKQLSKRFTLIGFCIYI